MTAQANKITISPCPDCQEHDVVLELFSVQDENVVWNGECECGREWNLISPEKLPGGEDGN